MQLNMPIPGEFTRLLAPESRVLARSSPVYVKGEDPIVIRSDDQHRQIDPLARLKPADRVLYKEREAELTGEQSIAQKKLTEANQELYVQRQEARIEELEKTVKTLRKELSVARNNQRSFGTRSEDNEIARLKRRVAQLEYENNELRNGAYVSIDEGIGLRGEVVLHDSRQPELRAAQRARRQSAPKSPEPVKRKEKNANDKFAHIKPRVQTGLRSTDSPVAELSGDVVYAQQSPPRIMYRDVGAEYPRVTYGEPTYIGSGYTQEYASGYPAVSSGYVSGLPSYTSLPTRTVERIIDETPRVYSASRILGPETVLLE